VISVHIITTERLFGYVLSFVCSLFVILAIIHIGYVTLKIERTRLKKSLTRKAGDER